MLLIDFVMLLIVAVLVHFGVGVAPFVWILALLLLILGRLLKGERI